MIWQGSPLGFDDRDGRPISHDGNEPTLVTGPMGVNKSMGHAANALLDDEGERSFIVWDPALELAAITAKWRRKVCGAKNVHIVNPDGMLAKVRPDLKSSKWNPLEEPDATSPELGDTCSLISAALVPDDGNQLQKHFVDAARSAVTAMLKTEILEAAAARAELKSTAAKGLDEKALARLRGLSVPSLANVRARLALDSDTLAKLVKKILENTQDFDLKTRLPRFTVPGSDERQSVLANVESAMEWMRTALRNDMTGKGGFRLAPIRDKATTIFCGLSPDKVTPQYMRLFLSLALSALYREDGVPVTVLIDEAYVLGRHDEVTKALSILRKFNCRVSVIFQSHGQIDRLYPDDSDLFTSGAVMAFRASGEKSARAMSFRAGEEVVPSPSYSDPASPAELRVKPSWSPHKRERIPAGMMFSIPRGKALVWLPGDDAPRISRVKGYFELPELNARADPNPYYQGPAARSASRRKWVRAAGVLLAAAALLRPVPLTDGKAAGMHNRGETAGLRAASRPEQPAARRAVVSTSRGPR